MDGRRQEAQVDTPWEDDVHLLVRHGSWEAFPELRTLRRWPPYLRAGGTDERASGVRLLEQVLRQALDSWHTEAPCDAEAMRALLGLGQRGRRVLNGDHGLRGAAGRRIDIGWDQFSRHYERPLVERFAARLRDCSEDPAALGEPQLVSLSFHDLERAAATLHRRLEQQFRPDVVITLSGPGSFTACYLMRLDPRDVPVVMATTFPMREEPQEAERAFAKAAESTGAPHLATSKWSIYLPAIVGHLPPGCRVAIVDDRVVSGDSHRLVRRELQDLGYQVACVALFADPAVPIPGLMIGREISGPFEMPWGPASGRD